MRDYGKVSPQFWVGRTGKSLRGDLEAQVVALYLMTSPHANMIGVYYCPVEYIAKETGLPIEGASKALQSLIDSDFCTYEEGSEAVFVHRMAVFQVGETLQPKDLRVKGVLREWSNIANPQLRQAFADRYAAAYHLPTGQKSEAPCKPLASQEQEQEQEQDSCPPAAGDELAGFAEFWSTWPKSDRKQSKGKCLSVWKKAHAERVAADVLAHVKRMKASEAWTKQGGQFIPAPLVYLNDRRWEGAEAGSAAAESECGAWV